MQEAILGELENLFLALSDKTRLRLLSLISNGEQSVGYLADALNESQPKVSRHLAYLRSSGLVSTRRDGKWIYYDIDQGVSDGVMQIVDATLRAIGVDNLTDATMDVYTGTATEDDICVEPHIDDWSPTEMDVFLL